MIVFPYKSYILQVSTPFVPDLSSIDLGLVLICLPSCLLSYHTFSSSWPLRNEIYSASVIAIPVTITTSTPNII